MVRLDCDERRNGEYELKKSGKPREMRGMNNEVKEVYKRLVYKTESRHVQQYEQFLKKPMIAKLHNQHKNNS